jgi:hypothetical protein
MEKRIYLEQLIEKIRAVGEDFETDETDADALLVKDKEIGVFTDELLRVVNAYIKSELATEEELATSYGEEEEEEELYITDWFDDDLD